MPYTFTKTERNNLKASSFETKSLLYLASNNHKYQDVTVLTIDCFNDVAGMCDEEKLWDVQAKGENNLTPRKIGTYLITLYENYISAFATYFQEFIFFMPQLKERYLIDTSLSIYGINNFRDDQREKVVDGLKYVAKLDQNIDINDFLEMVLFVEDRSRESTYVKGIMKFKSSKLNDDNFYLAIFNEIRDKQTTLKNSNIENLIIESPKDVLAFQRHLTNEDLQLFVLNRLVGGDVFSNKNSMPRSYGVFLKNIEDDLLEDHIFEQNAEISRAFFDKHNQKDFWKLFSAIFKVLSKDKSKKVSEVIRELDKNLIERTDHMNMDSTRFLIAMVRDGLVSEN